MMANRPNYLDLRSESHGSTSTGLPSPRLHVAGDVPPELSPLDAFAAQSRRLAKQLEESMNSGGKRISRLPPLAIADSLNQARPTYFRSFSAEAGAGTPTSPLGSPGIGLKMEVEAPLNRPVSVHPLLSGAAGATGAPPPLPAEPSPQLDIRHEGQLRGRTRPNPNQPHGPEYFGARRERSPQSLDRGQSLIPTENGSSDIQSRPSIESMRSHGHASRRANDVSLGITNYDSRALAPPRSPFAQRTPSPKSMSMDSSDDDVSTSNAPRVLSPPRKLSSSSGLSISPISPTTHSIPRSPSISSEMSVGGTRLPRPAFNFSRPLSRASVTGLPVDLPSRQTSSDSQPSFILADDTAHTPVSIHSDGFPENSNETGAAPSYVYSRFSLPRGKVLQRNSLIFQENLPQAQFSWEQPVPFTNVESMTGGAPPSPPFRPSNSSLRPEPSQLRPSLDHAITSTELGQPSFELERPSLDPGRPSLDPGKTSGEQGRSVAYQPTPSLSSSATIKARSQHSLASAADLPAEEHVSKAIEYHEAGALTKSTYHLRLAARQNHPTGMLLYALACRHGWGMRPNQKEGVVWLRRAADSASLEIADDEDLIRDGKTVDILERNTRKAQFALSIYEIGVSHMNGWGIDQDKVLGLRCFEIAGSWGDADALAEAGFCYAQGLGCKKDLKKSAKFYRQAESKGISMVGNSWIYKAKYNDEAGEKTISEARPSPEKAKDKIPRSKSRSRTMFGRMKSTS